MEKLVKLFKISECKQKNTFNTSCCKKDTVFFKSAIFLTIFLTTSVIAAVPGVSPKDSANIVDVSHGIGIPLGGIGTGYSMFGKYGFVRENFKDMPDNVPYGGGGITPEHSFTSEPTKKASFGFTLKSGSTTYVLQEKKAAWDNGTPFDKVSCYAFLPKAYYVFSKSGINLNVSMVAFSPMIAHDFASSTLPIQVFDITVANTGSAATTVELRLVNSQSGTATGSKVVFGDANNQLAFGAISGTANGNGVTVPLSIDANGSKTARFFIAWYYPAISNFGLGTFKRYYTKNFANASSVIDLGVQSANDWSAKIDTWHDAFEVPSYFKRLWFSSLSSIAASTIMTDNPYFLEKETPHPFWNTFDVTTYSTWAYLINWPEIERMDFDQVTKHIPKTGNSKGLVYHSAWTEGGDSYLEEPIYLARIFRNYRWFNDPEWGKTNFPVMVDVANRAFSKNCIDNLINSPEGNQSYDIWKMPGINSFNNSSWIYGLHGMESMSKALNMQASISNMSVSELKQKAIKKFDELLWNSTMNYWNVTYLTPGSNTIDDAKAAFTDQLFGKWIVGVDINADSVLPRSKVKQTVEKLYTHNLLDDKSANFRGWPNGMKYGPSPNYAPVPYLNAMHARTCWFGGQLNLGSQLGLAGNEAAALDVFKSVEKSLLNNHLAVGEWNRSINSSFKAVVEGGESAKDTPRFPSYPRYKSCWEYVVRILGLQMDEKYLYLAPFKTFGFKINSFPLAGMKLTVKVDSNWKYIKVNGVSVTGGAQIDRKLKESVIEFTSTQTNVGNVVETAIQPFTVHGVNEKNGLSVSFTLQGNANLSLVLYTAQGRVVAKTDIVAKKGNNRYFFKGIAKLPTAFYLLRASVDGKELGTTRIVLK